MGFLFKDNTFARNTHIANADLYRTARHDPDVRRHDPAPGRGDSCRAAGASKGWIDDFIHQQVEAGPPAFQFDFREQEACPFLLMVRSVRTANYQLIA